MQDTVSYLQLQLSPTEQQDASPSETAAVCVNAPRHVSTPADILDCPAEMQWLASILASPPPPPIGLSDSPATAHMLLTR